MNVAQRQQTINTVLALYRSLLRQVYHEDNPFRRQRLQKQLRSEVDQLRDQHQSSPPEAQPTLDELTQRAEDKLKFLRSVTPRIRIRRAPTRAMENAEDGGDGAMDGRKLFVVRDGEVVNVGEEIAKQSKAMSNWMDGNIDPEMYERHMRLNRRMRFEEGPLKGYPRNRFADWGVE